MSELFGTLLMERDIIRPSITAKPYKFNYIWL